MSSCSENTVYEGSAVLAGDLAITCAFAGTSLIRRGGRGPPGDPGPVRAPTVIKAIGGSVQPSAHTPSGHPCKAAGFAACRLLKNTRGGAN